MKTNFKQSYLNDICDNPIMLFSYINHNVTMDIWDSETGQILWENVPLLNALNMVSQNDNLECGFNNNETVEKAWNDDGNEIIAYEK